MYNSRPRRTNYDGYPEWLVVPENYSGNAFRESVEKIIDEIEEESAGREDEGCAEGMEAAQISAEPVHKAFEENHKKGGGLFSRTGFGFNLSNLFGSIGFEELLIIGLILLIAQNENNEDIIVLLALLLFIG